VRISGQDCERGTFSHRHAHVFYQDRDGHYCPISDTIHNSESEGRQFIASSSHLSEYAVLGFEYGYAQTLPNTLTLWEAQFGDFANGAQIMIDQFIASGESKWNVHQGLVMLLPHGYDGAGPEHSSCRVERYLQLSDSPDTPHSGKVKQDIYEECNMQIINATTSAQIFHAFRRQLLRPFRKPLIVVAPKKMLKLREASSELKDFAVNTSFQRIISDKSVDNNKVKKVIFCSG
jgi:probable 2-oxoglutarate dehydrogenase E1 component DHKTD1